MNRSFGQNFQRSFRTNIFPTNGVRDENIVTITEDDGTTSDGREGEVTWFNSAVFKYAHDSSRYCELSPPISS